jgi:hypothetical protein
MVRIQAEIFQIYLISSERKEKDKVEQLAEREGFTNSTCALSQN